MNEQGGPGWQNPSWNEPGPSWGAPGAPHPGPQWNAGAPAGGPPPGGGPYWTPGAQRPHDPRPGVVPLRPLAFGEILDGSINAVRRRPLLTLGLAAVVVTVQQLIVLLGARTAHVPISFSFSAFAGEGAQSATINPFDRTNIGGLIGYAASELIAAIISLILIGLLVLVIGESVLGRTSPAREIWTQGRRQLWQLVVGALYGGLLPWLPAVVGGAAVGVGLGFVSVDLGVGVGVLVVVGLLVFPGAYLWGAMTLVAPTLMLERTGPVRAVRRSITLVRRDFWRVWGIRAVTVLIAGVISGIATVPFGIVGAVISGGPDDLLAAAVSTIGTIIASTFLTPFTAGVYTLLYVDRRMRAEGWDIELAERARTGAPLSTVPAAEAL